MDAGASPSAQLADDPPGSSTTRKRRRGSRGGRKRRSRAAGGDSTGTGTDAERDSSGSSGRAKRGASPAESTPASSSKSAPKSSAKTEDGSASSRGSGARTAKKSSARGATRGRSTKASSSAGTAKQETSSSGSGASQAPKTRRATRTRRRSPSEDVEPQASTQTAEGDPARKGRRRGRRGGRRRRADEAPVEVEVIPGEDDDLPELPELPDEAQLVEEARGRRSKKATSRKKASKTSKKTVTKADGSRSGRREASVSRRSSESDAEDRSPGSSVILVNAVGDDEKRVAVLDGGGLIQDFQMTVKSENSLVNDIYRGRVVNLEPAIGAAFIDFGQGRNGFLHTSDVLTSYGDKDWSLDKLLMTKVDPGELDETSGASADLIDDDDGAGDGESKVRNKKRGRSTRQRSRPRLPITSLVKKGQMVVVQVTKEAIGDKGPTLTTYISIPGRYLVLMPCIPRIGVSRKIEDEKERRRLKRILQSLKVPEGMGVIVRTAGVSHKKTDLKRDLDYLLNTWEDFGKQLTRGHGPAPLYQESNVAIRTMRDLFSEDTETVYVDDHETYDRIVDFTTRLMPEHVDRIKLHEGARPLFHSHSLEQDFERIFARRVELPSGGSIVFDQTEALVAIDVNSGKTRTDGFDFEEIALKTNLEAVPEIARQIRLRDLGGIVVIDFIDMLRASNLRSVERTLRTAFATDRARSKLGRISQFGLLELTRQRLGPGITNKLFHTCPTCRGSGRLRNVASRSAAILRRLGASLTLKGFSQIEVRAHPEVIDYLRGHCSDELRALEHRSQRKLQLTSVAEQTEDSVLRYLRADGREVRPGGRRKH